MWQKVLVLVYSDRPLEERAEVLGISHSSVPTILHDGSDIRMLTDRSDPIAMHKCQQEHQSAAPCWSNLGERIIFFAPEDFDWNRFIISSVSRVWVAEANVQDATICWQGDSHTCSVFCDAKSVILCWTFYPRKYIKWSELCKLVRPGVHLRSNQLGSTRQHYQGEQFSRQSE